MSSFGAFEVIAAEGLEQKIASEKSEEKLQEAIYDVRKKFGSFLNDAKDNYGFKQRIAMVKDDMMKTVDQHLMPVTGVMNKVVATMRRDWRAASSSRQFQDDVPPGTPPNFGPYDESGHFEDLRKYPSEERQKKYDDSTMRGFADAESKRTSRRIASCEVVWQEAPDEDPQHRIAYPEESVELSVKPNGDELWSWEVKEGSSVKGSGDCTTPDQAQQSAEDCYKVEIRKLESSRVGKSILRDFDSWAQAEGTLNDPVGDFLNQTGEEWGESDLEKLYNHVDRRYSSRRDSNISDTTGERRRQRRSEMGYDEEGGGSPSLPVNSAESFYNLTGIYPDEVIDNRKKSSRVTSNDEEDEDLFDTTPGSTSELKRIIELGPAGHPDYHRAVEQLKHRQSSRRRSDVVENEGDWEGYLDSVDDNAPEKIDHLFTEDSLDSNFSSETPKPNFVAQRQAAGKHRKERVSRLEQFFTGAWEDYPHPAADQKAYDDWKARTHDPETGVYLNPRERDTNTWTGPQRVHPSRVSRRVNPQLLDEYSQWSRTMGLSPRDPDTLDIFNDDNTGGNSLSEDDYNGLSEHYKMSSLKQYFTKRAVQDERALLEKADAALTDLLNNRAEVFQETLAPIQQALQAVQYAEAVEQQANPMQVMPPAGTVNVMPQMDGPGAPPSLNMPPVGPPPPGSVDPLAGVQGTGDPLMDGLAAAGAQRQGSLQRFFTASEGRWREEGLGGSMSFYGDDGELYGGYYPDGDSYLWTLTNSDGEPFAEGRANSLDEAIYRVEYAQDGETPYDSDESEVW